jgi:Tfp pilus assembly protein PilV
MNKKLFANAKPESGASLIEVMGAIIMVGIGVALFLRVQGSSTKDSTTNSKMLVAGKMVEGLLEDTRISIFKDTLVNWPPKDTVVAAAAPNFIRLSRTVSNAYSPKDGALVNNVKQLVIKASWTFPKKDSVEITTYVSKRF